MWIYLANPVISLAGVDPTFVELGVAYSEDGATASDPADQVNTTPAVTVAGATVDFTTLGDYIVTYDVTDSTSHAATQVTRTVTVVIGKYKYLLMRKISRFDF